MNNIEKLLKINESYEQCECFRIKETKNKIIQVMYEALKFCQNPDLIPVQASLRASLALIECKQLAAEVLEEK